jgi:phosphatidylethanolamine/phosphatidyl-N-methylethanolamine N-methyltransferase
LSTHPLRTRSPRREPPRTKFEDRLIDEARFIRSWFDSPLKAGAVSPSGRFLARAMAKCVDPKAPGLIVELGPGTGPVTEALIARGVPADKLVLVEYDASFCKLLERRFPGVHLLQGDAYRLSETLRHLHGEKISTVVSSLPLLTRPERERIALLDEAFDLMGPDGDFIQFTYGLVSPMPLKFSRRTAADYRGVVSQPVWLNLPPARVWRYRRADAKAGAHAEPAINKRIVFPPVLDSFHRKQVAPALALIRKIADGGRDGRR